MRLDIAGTALALMQMRLPDAPQGANAATAAAAALADDKLRGEALSLRAGAHSMPGMANAAMADATAALALGESRALQGQAGRA